MAERIVVLLSILLCLIFFTATEEILDKNQNNDFYEKNYKCPDGWQQRCEKCYLFVKEEKAWTDALYHCQQRGGDLVTIKEFAVNMFLSRYVKYESDSARSIWTGLNDRVKEGEFKWSDGSEAITQEFRWYPDEPKDSAPGEDCVEMYVRSNQYLWNDAPCSESLPFVCQTDGCVNGTQRCDNGKCVSKKLVCDGVDNCGDNSDEKNCSTSCGKYIYGTMGNFTSPNYPNPYGDNRDCTWTIEVPETYKIELKFHSFHVEEGFDYVEVLDGKTLASKSFGKFNGNKIPKVVTTTSNVVRVSLVTDESESYKGFFAEFKAVKKDCNVEKTISKDSEYYFNSPNFPSNYPDETQCIWKFKHSDPLKILTLIILEIDTEKNNDIIEVRDGDSSDAYLLGRFSGQKTPPAIFSSTEKLWVKFQSNFQNSRKGFRAVIKAGCYVAINASQGVISSPGFGHANYPNLLRCTWMVTEPQNRSLAFIFHKFDTERKYDELTLKMRTGGIIAQYSGQKTKGWLDNSWILETNQSFIEVKFKSDVTYQLAGFNATFSIGCSQLQQINGGRVTGKTHYGAIALYECDDKYARKDGSKRTCEYGGSWSKPVPFCEKIDCGHPGNVGNGGFLVSSSNNASFELNTTITYYCNAGYKLVGTEKRVCQNTSIWSGSQPVCEIHLCKDPGIPDSGVRNSDNFQVGQSVSYSCKEGFKIEGATTITCNVDGTWSSEAPVCKAIYCIKPDQTDNSIIKGVPENSTVLPYGTIINVTCKTGFKLSGNGSVRCDAPGLWKPDLPICTDVNECDATDACQGNGSTCVNIIGSFRCVCDSGYEKVNSTACKDVNECNKKNETVTCNQICVNTPGGYRCECEEGYFLYNGDNTTLDRIELRMAIVNHTCFGNQCPVADIPDHGYVINYGNRYPVVLKYICNNGFVLKGHQNVKCMKNGKWDKTFPTCVAASCAEPTKVNNAEYTINGTKHQNMTGYKVDSTIAYKCNPGFERVSGNLNRECMHNISHAFWSGDLPVCKKKLCGDLLKPVNGIVFLTGILFGDVATYTCDGGYEIIGNDKQTCTENGQWNGTKPVCAASPCPDPGVPEHGIRMGNVALGETVTFVCFKRGYTLEGNATRTCKYMKNKGNQWTGTLPKCKDTTKPVFDCPPRVNFTLPRFEKELFVNWTVPTVTDNSGEAVNIIKLPNISPPNVLKFGVNSITYTATDKNGNVATCNVIVDIQDKEIPRIKCPKNVVINSDVPTKVYWGRVISTDNINTKSISFNPANGTVFQSNRYHKVVATVTDISGNKDTCVIEVFVKGCGCTLRDCPDYKPDKGISTCHIKDLGAGHIISCTLECPKNLTSVDVHFQKNYNCDPKTGWPSKHIPGCAAKKNITSCLEATMTIGFNATVAGKISSTDLDNNVKKLLKFMNSLSSQCGGVLFKHLRTTIINNTVITNFLFEPNQNVVITHSAGQMLDACSSDTVAKLNTKKIDALLLVSDAKKDIFGDDISFTTVSCCNNTKHYCCPTGHLIRTPSNSYLANGICLACGPGTFHNVTENKCKSCPVGTYTPTEAFDQCIVCPSGKSTLSIQSTACTDLCGAGSYSSTGLQPTCRKCDYGEYQPTTGKKECKKCPTGTATAKRGAINIAECRAPCQLGHISSTGLQNCSKCVKGTYQDETGRALCKQCPSGGIYVGKEGATSVKDCPTTNACDQKLCQNNAQCVPGNYTFTCNCKPGWSGKYCEVDINECDSSPCGNNGTCTDLINGYNCTCLKGITGVNCETNINDCKNDTCKNYGVCEDKIDDFKCFCPAGFTGKRCETDINECNSSPCMHNSTCSDLINNFKCNCTPGYEGIKCEKDIDECLSTPCFNNATCEDLIDNVRCICQPGYTGSFCVVDIDECKGEPCQNNASCIDLVNAYRCDCKPGYTGFNCSTEIDECNPSPCLRNSTCIDLVNAFKCNCEAGYYGDRCEFEKNECESLPCENNATCIDKVNDYQCICPFGYTGKNCETNINECDPDPCRNGVCNDLIGDYSCTCQHGYTGKNCSVIIDNCLSDPCINNGTCTNQVGNYTCTCPAGYSGRNCETDIDECTPDPCNGRATNCSNLIDDYICYCHPRYRGKNCSIDIDKCKPQPCFHNSTCTNVYESNDFKCNCTLGYRGKRCENEIDECLTKPCQNNGSCTDLIGKYSCFCPTGFTGLNCEINIDDCKNVTCYNGGICVDSVNEYSCECPVTHKGSHCEKKIPDEVDIKLPGGKSSFLLQPNISTVSEFTLSLWFRYTTNPAKGTILSLLNGEKNIPDKFLEMDEKSLKLSIASNKVNIPLQSTVNNKYWHHVFVAMSGITTQMTIAIDGRILETSTRPFLQNVEFFKPYGMLVVGKKINASGYLIDDGFAGEVSQLGIWKRIFSDVERIALSKNCTTNLNDSIIPWIGLLNNAGMNVSLIESWTCGKNQCPSDYTGQFCETEIDKIPPTVIMCPPSKKVITPDATTRVTWPEPIFTDDKGVVEIVRSHASGQAFPWGDFVVTYIAKDAFDNSVTCVFELFVTSFNCSELTTRNNSIDGCGTWKWGRFCKYQCQPNFEIAVPIPPFYSCGRMGSWSHGPPTYPENPDNLLPACSAKSKPGNAGTNTFSYVTSQCDEAFKLNFTRQFKTLIMSLQNTWQICGDSCNFDNIRVKCTGGRRMRRDAAAVVPYTVDVTFDAEFENINDSLTTSLQEGIKDGTIDMTLNVGGVNVSVDTNTTVVVVTSLKCGNGSALKNSKCVACPLGTFKNDTSQKCDKCPMNTYSNTFAASQCTLCPNGKLTLSIGTNSLKKCLDRCLPGHFINTSNYQCSSCPVGFYSEESEQTSCTPCPAGTTTTLPGASKKTFCTVTCPLGSEILASKCTPCLPGYYRNMASQTECIPCPYGETTYEAGNKDGNCRVKCPLGQELSPDEQECMECDVGYYKENALSPQCTKCPNKFITKGFESKSRQQCFAPPNVTLYDATLSFTSMAWNEDMNNKSSPKFRHAAHAITAALLSVYTKENTLISITVNELRSGSIVSQMTFSFASNFVDPFKPLKEKIESGSIGGVKVNASTFRTDRCVHFTCPVDQYCWYNVSGAGCICQAGHYMSNDGQKCFADCKKDYCLNDGTCQRSDNGRICRCPSKYSGSRCEDKDNSHDYALVIGLVLAAVVLIILIGYCLKRRKSALQIKERPLTDDVEVISGYPDNIRTTPIVLRVEPNAFVNKTFDNKAADFDDDDTVSDAPNIKSNKVTVFLKPKSDDVEMDVVTSDTTVEPLQNGERKSDNPHMSFI